MENNNNKKTPEQRLALIYAITEGKIEAENVLKEILPLIEDYFICNAEYKDGEISLRLYNGQKFKIGIKEE
ncbi:MAG: hypothetical protein K2L42_06785 [Clostridia bacterium]|nr:hypothetical protein [Clostridia bacterium]